MPTVQGSGFDPITLSALATPSTNWAQRRQDKQMEAYYAAQTAQLNQQMLADQRAQEDDLSKAIDSFNNLGLDQIGQQQVNHEINRIVRQEAANKFRTEYGSDPKKWLERGEGIALADSLRNFRSSPVFQQVLQNQFQKFQYGDDKKKGLLDRAVTWTTTDGKQKTGTMEEQLADYNAGKVGQLTYNGAYAVPKDFGDQFRSTYFTGDVPMTINGQKGFATRYGVLDKDRKRIIGAVPVALDQAQADWTNLGGNVNDFQDYLRRTGGNLGLNYKSDNYDDYLKEQQQLAISRGNLAVAQGGLAERRRHNQVMEARQAQQDSQSGGQPDVLRSVLSQYGGSLANAPSYTTQGRNGAEERGKRFNTGTFKNRFAALYGLTMNGRGGYNGRLDRNMLKDAVMYNSNRPLSLKGKGAYDWSNVFNNASILDAGGEVVVDTNGNAFVKSTVSVPQSDFDKNKLAQYEKGNYTLRDAPGWKPPAGKEDQEAPKDVVFDVLLPLQPGSMTDFGLQEKLNKTNREYLLEED